MVVLSAQVTAATLAVGYDVFSAQPFLDFATAKYRRRVKRIGITGSTAIGDTVFQLKYGAREVANGLYNTQTGVDLDDSADMVLIVDTDVNQIDEPIILQVTDAATSNPCLIKIEIDNA